MFKIRNATQSIAQIDLYDEIGLWGINASDFGAAMKDVTAPNIELNINSPGGDVFDGMAIYNIIKRHPATVHANIDGMAASIASVIMQAADTITAPENSTTMIHAPWGMGIGGAEDMRALADQLDKTQGQIIDIYVKRAGEERREEITAAVEAETWMTGPEALALGLVDSVGDEVKLAACADLAKFKYRNAPQSEPVKIEPYRAADVAARQAIARFHALKGRI